MADGRIKVKLDKTMIKNKANKGINKAQDWLDNEIIADTDKYTPFMTGQLAKSVRVASRGMIEYNVPYARRLYYGDGLRFNRTHHPLAGAFWFERSKSVHRKKWVDGVNKVVGGEV